LRVTKNQSFLSKKEYLLQVARKLFFANGIIVCKFYILTRKFHTDRDEEAAKADGARRAKDWDAGLYEYSIILLKSQFETNAVVMSLP
jgi:hypothetical protein